MFSTSVVLPAKKEVYSVLCIKFANFNSPTPRFTKNAFHLVLAKFLTGFNIILLKFGAGFFLKRNCQIFFVHVNITNESTFENVITNITS